jgi:hypothetical protein
VTAWTTKKKATKPFETLEPVCQPTHGHKQENLNLQQDWYENLEHLFFFNKAFPNLRKVL